jgi:hypothetical protein
MMIVTRGMVEASQAWWKHRRHGGRIRNMMEESEAGWKNQKQGGRIGSKHRRHGGNIGYMVIVTRYNDRRMRYDNISRVLRYQTPQRCQSYNVRTKKKRKYIEITLC